MALLDIIKVGGQTVRIYSVHNRGMPYLKLSYNWAGEWRSKLLRNANPADEKRARGVAREVATAMAQGRADQIGDIGEGLKLLRIAEDSLAKSGVPIDVACREYAYAAEILDGVGTVIDAAQFFVRNKAIIAREIATHDAVEEFIEAQKHDHASEKYLQDIRSRLRRFARENGGFLTEHTTTHLKLWLRGLSLSPRTRNNFLSLLKTFFHWAQEENYLPRNTPTPADEIKLLSAPTEIRIHDADTVAKMMAGAIEHDPLCIPYLAIGYFAGVRPKEMQRMTARAIRFEHADIEVKEWQAKQTRRKGHRRLTPMQPNLMAWLTEFPVRDQIATSWTRNRVSRLAKKLGVEWQNDVMRHSAISNLVALTSNIDQVSLWMGNSRQIIYSHYLSQVTPKEAKLFFSIEPPKVSKIARLSA